MENVSEIYLHSTSGIKRTALEKWLLLKSRQDVQVVSIAAEAATECPQPVGKDSAVQCLFRRLPQNLLERAGSAEMHIGIENFIYRSNSDRLWYDNVAIAATFVLPEDTVGFLATIGEIDNRIPCEYAPKDAPDIAKPLGYRVTVGERINHALPHVLRDNWAAAVDAKNVDRVDQIVSALCCLDKKFNILPTIP